jgi:bifunctional DNA-binding transcriptional regulator/antitoxin component of YhaV-PrlF toxin-antitoxin module
LNSHGIVVIPIEVRAKLLILRSSMAL